MISKKRKCEKCRLEPYGTTQSIWIGHMRWRKQLWVNYRYFVVAWPRLLLLWPQQGRKLTLRSRLLLDATSWRHSVRLANPNRTCSYLFIYQINNHCWRSEHNLFCATRKLTEEHHARTHARTQWNNWAVKEFMNEIAININCLEFKYWRIQKLEKGAYELGSASL